MLVHYVYTFEGCCPLTEFCQLQNSLCLQVLRSPILAPLLHGIRTVDVSQSLRRGTRNGITKLSQRARPIFGRAAITLIIDPHSSLLLFLTYSQPSQIGRLPYFTWCGLSAHLESRSEMCCTRLAVNTERKKSPKIRHLRTIAQLCRALSSQLRHVSTIKTELVKQEYLLQMKRQRQQEGQHPLTGQRAPPISGET